MLVAAHVVLIVAVALVLAKHWQATTNKWYWTSLVVHSVAGISLGLIYTYYYTANDTWIFFEDAKVLARMAKQDFPSYLMALTDFSGAATVDLLTRDFRSEVFIKILSFFSLITGDSYWLCAAYFSLLSSMASWFLYRRIIMYFEHSAVAGVLAFLIFPSIVFWSSGIEKEMISLAALYFLAGLFLQFIHAQKLPLMHLLLAIPAALVMWALKYYWAGVFFVAVIAGLLTHYLMKQASKRYLMLSFVVCFATVSVGVSFLHPNFYLNQFLEAVMANHDAFIPLSSDQNTIHFYNLSPTVSSVVINAPWALASGIFRPFLGEGQGTLGLVASLENFSILVLAISFAWGNRKEFRGSINVLYLTATSYCVVLCVFLALSTPNLGTLSRYRVGFLPFLIFMLAYRNPLIDFVEKKFRTPR